MIICMPFIPAVSLVTEDDLFEIYWKYWELGDWGYSDREAARLAIGFFGLDGLVSYDLGDLRFTPDMVERLTPSDDYSDLPF